MKLQKDGSMENVRTVGDLKKAIKDLPDDLRVSQGFSDSCDVVIFNLNRSDMHITFKPGGDWADITGEEI